MYFFINFLRAFGAIIITNSHYTSIYPIPLIASGGLLGDVIFFAVSGYCFSSIKEDFFKWYKGRIIRIYTPVFIITSLYLIMKFYNFEKMNPFDYFIYPTYYHFVASIMVIYIPLYFIVKSEKYIKKIPTIIGVTYILQLILYFTMYDYSYYHIDTVREPMIRFLFFYSMLLGLYFKENNNKFIDKNSFFNWISTIFIAIIYFGSKIIFSKIPKYAPYQILNQIILFILLYFIFRLFSGLEEKIRNLPEVIKKSINSLAKITLEIYLVQYVIIPRLSYFIFPLNWIIVSVTILISAIALNKISSSCIQLIKRKEGKYEAISNRSL